MGMHSETTVAILLENENAVDDISARDIHLAPGELITVGRASRKGEKTKSRAAENHNGFISSPVVSRTHAEIALAEDNVNETPRVFLKDKSSMHGTFLNQEKIVPNVPHRMKSGDIIQFGVTVVCKADTFVAPRYRVTITDSKQDDCVRRQSPFFGRTFVAPVFDSDISIAGSDDEDDSVPDVQGSSAKNPITFDDEPAVIPETILPLVQPAFKELELDLDLETPLSDNAAWSPSETPSSPIPSSSEFGALDDSESDNEAEEDDQEEVEMELESEPDLDFQSEENAKMNPISPDLGAKADGGLSAADENRLPGRGIFEFIASSELKHMSNQHAPFVASKGSNLPILSDESQSLEADPWRETDPFFMDDDSEVAVVNPLQLTLNQPCPDFKNTPLPSVSKLQRLNVDEGSNTLPPLNFAKDTPKKAALSIEELINGADIIRTCQTSSTAGRKRKADDISVDIPDLDVSAQRSMSPAIVNIGEDAVDATVAFAEPSTKITNDPEPPRKKSKLGVLQLTGGILLGAVGVLYTLIAVPEEWAS